MSESAHPETIYFSACLAAGIFTPSADGLEPTDFSHHPEVFEYLQDYAKFTANKAPSVELVERKHPDFEFIPGVDITWARAQMRAHAKSERTHRQLHRALRLSKEGEHDQALSVMANSTKTVLRNLSSRGTSLKKWQLNGHHTTHVPPPPGPLAYITDGGQEPKRLWLITARTSVGKSWRLCEHAVAALEGGWNVTYFSLEMPEEEVIERVQTIAFGMNAKEMDRATRNKAHEMWAAGLGGDLVIRGPEDGYVTPSVVAGAAEENTLLIVDHVGLMRDTAGAKAIGEWNIMGAISNELKQIALSENVPILAAGQVNRAGAKTRPGAHHGIDNIGLSDALGQDTDVHIALDPYGPEVRMSYVTKNRSGRANVKWFTAFEPHHGNFEVITAQEARRRWSESEEIDEAWNPDKEAIVAD